MREFTITTAKIRDAWNKIQQGINPIPSQSALSGYVTGRWKGTEKDSFVGCSGAEMNDWLQNGYFPEGDAASIGQGTAADVDTPYVEWDEDEGDLFVESVLAGEDAPYARWENNEAKRGLKIRACFDTNAGTPAKALSEYLTWILKVVESAGAQGIAPDVELFISSGDSFKGKPSKEKFIIPVVKAGEVVDVTAWRAFLSPGAFRSLGFLAMGIAGEENGLQLTNGLGHALGHSFDVRKDGDVLTIDCPGSFRTFDEAAMNAKVEKAMAS